MKAKSFFLLLIFCLQSACSLGEREISSREPYYRVHYSEHALPHRLVARQSHYRAYRAYDQARRELGVPIDRGLYNIEIEQALRRLKGGSYSEETTLRVTRHLEEVVRGLRENLTGRSRDDIFLNGLLLYHGLGVDPQLELGLIQIRLAASFGQPDARRFLFARGELLPVSITRSLEL